MMDESHEHRLKRLRMRSMRRGTKEMDIILDRFATDNLTDLGPDELDTYDALLEENDQELYQWVSGQASAPDRFAALIERIRAVSEGAK